MMIPNDSRINPAINRMSISSVDTADSARSTRDSILSLYGHRSYYQKILDPREGPFAMALEMQADCSRVSRIIDDHLGGDYLPVEAASNVVVKGLDVPAPASIEPLYGLEQVRPCMQVSWNYPGRAIAVTLVFGHPHLLSFEEDEVLQVAPLSETTLRVRKTTTGEEGLALSHSLIPYYPYRARLLFRSYAGPPIASPFEYVDVSEKELFDEPIHGFDVWRPWRMKTGETGIAPDESFDCVPPPTPVRSTFPSRTRKWRQVRGAEA